MNFRPIQEKAGVSYVQLQVKVYKNLVMKILPILNRYFFFNRMVKFMDIFFFESGKIYMKDAECDEENKNLFSDFCNF